jgi:HK97 family phage major capsid protein
MPTLVELRADRQARAAELAPILALGEQATLEDLDRGEALAATIEELDGQIGQFNRLGALSTRLGSPASVNLPVPLPGAGTMTLTTLQPAGTITAPAGTAFVIPATALRGKVTAFKARGNRSAEEAAYRFGMWFAAIVGHGFAKQFCRNQGLELRWADAGGNPMNLAQSEGVNTAGGFLVLPEFEQDMIDLRERYGVFRQHAKVVPMNSDTKSVPRRTGGLTAYYTAELATITESQKGWDRVTLTAKKLAVLAKYSSELDEDSMIDIGNDLAEEISYAFSVAEDDAGFNGDGTSTYGGIVGVRNKLLNLSATRANIAGLTVASGNLWSEITIGDFNTMKSKLPEYAHTSRTAFYASRVFYDAVMEKLMLAAGGVTAAEIAAGRPMEMFMGYPVHIAQKMPLVEANDVVCCLFGDLSLAARFGDRRSTTIATSEHLNFAEDEIAIRGTERYDIVVHDVGNESATAALRVAGPIVGLLTAAS